MEDEIHATEPAEETNGHELFEFTDQDSNLPSGLSLAKQTSLVRNQGTRLTMQVKKNKSPSRLQRIS
jgi:hypothetical protein